MWDRKLSGRPLIGRPLDGGRPLAQPGQTTVGSGGVVAPSTAGEPIGLLLILTKAS